MFLAMARGRSRWFLVIGFMCFIINVQKVTEGVNLINMEDFLESSKRIGVGFENLPKLWDYAWSGTKDVNFHLYTRDNPEDHYRLEAADLKNLEESPLKRDRTTKIIIHGWLDTTDMYWIHDFRNEYLAIGDYNIIVVDWDSMSWKQYLSAVDSTITVGEKVADLVKFLVSNEYITLENVHIVGHSLGAHIAGFVGTAMEGKIGRITGMDPAGPLFEFPFLRAPEERLDPSDAQFVDVIHTCGGNVGYAGALGHVDFYPNEGVSPQPGCSKMGSLMCSHLRAHKFMLESIIFPKAFIATRCNDWMDYSSNNCANEMTTYMGENVDLNARGSFFLGTNEEPPFGKGFVTFKTYICRD